MDKFQKEEFLNKLIRFLKIPSISALRSHKKDMLQAVKFLKAELLEIGFSRTCIEELYAKGLSNETNNPVIFAQRINSPKAPTVLIYGHYDVQPPDPLSEWKTKPFEPTVSNGKIFARGATDDKGQLFTHIAALKILANEWGSKWPLNIKILLEGEEETGGENIEKLVRENPKKFNSDVCLISDTGFMSREQPSIEIGLRGIVYFEIEAVLGKRDLHSGLFGGAVKNPINALAGIFSRLVDSKTGKILVPNFYDDVINLSTKERKELSKMGFTEIALRKDAGVKKLCGEKGFSTLERITVRPSFDINGIEGGFTGEGAKTVIPSKAIAKFSIRTVPNQNVDKVEKEVLDFIRKMEPNGVEIDVRAIHRGRGFLADSSSPFLKIASDSVMEIFGKRPVFSRSGGSIPVVPILKEILGAEIVMMGYGLPDDNLHSPNEKFDLGQFYGGILCNVEFLKRVSGERL